MGHRLSLTARTQIVSASRHFLLQAPLILSQLVLFRVVDCWSAMTAPLVVVVCELRYYYVTRVAMSRSCLGDKSSILHCTYTDSVNECASEPLVLLQGYVQWRHYIVTLFIALSHGLSSQWPVAASARPQGKPHWLV